MDFGRGFTPTNLKYMRSFYLAFPIRHALRDESAAAKTAIRRAKSAGKLNAPRSELPALRPELSWTHYRFLLSVADPTAREWYEREAAEQHWSTRQLDRQIAVLYYERLLASRRKAPIRKEAAAKLASVEPDQFIRDPYEGDNPAIGLILCSRKNEAIAKYSVLSEGRQIFAAKYVKVLPTEQELTREIERERRLIDAHHAGRSS